MAELAEALWITEVIQEFHLQRHEYGAAFLDLKFCDALIPPKLYEWEIAIPGRLL